MNEQEQLNKILYDLFGIGMVGAMGSLVADQEVVTEVVPPEVVQNPCNEVPMTRMQRCTLPGSVKAEYDERVKFSFYGCLGKCNHHTGVIVVASAVDVEKGVCFYGVAYCSPQDVYDKERGKHLAHLDLIRNMKTVALGKKKHYEINARIFCDIVANNDEPSWARDKVSSILRVHLEKSFKTWVR